MAGGEDSGPPALRNAALNALHGFAYRPFLADGIPVSARTVVAIPFKLPPEIPARTYPMPRLELGDFEPQASGGDLVSLSSLPPSLSKWYRGHISNSLKTFRTTRSRISFMTIYRGRASDEFSRKQRDNALLVSVRGA
jgi:hypothetical protein